MSTKFEKDMAAFERRYAAAERRADRAEEWSDEFDKRLEATRKMMEVGMGPMFAVWAQMKNSRGLDRLERLVAASIQGRTNGKG